MKLNALLMTALLLIAALPSSSDDFGAIYYTRGALGAAGVGKSVLGCGPTGTDGYDGELMLGADNPSTQISFGAHKVFGVGGWDHDTGFYIDDWRRSPAAGETLVFDEIYMWALPGTPKQDMLLYQFDVWGPNGWAYKLKLVSIPAGITYNGPREWSAAGDVITLPFYATADGTTGYKFRAEVTAPVPEPSSLLALVSGLAGVGGFALRRRKQ